MLGPPIPNVTITIPCPLPPDNKNSLPVLLPLLNVDWNAEDLATMGTNIERGQGGGPTRVGRDCPPLEGKNKLVVFNFLFELVCCFNVDHMYRQIVS